MSLTDDLTSKAVNDGSRAVQNSAKAAAGTLKAGESAVKGICLLLLSGSDFTTRNVMQAVKAVAFKKTGDIKYSKSNIDIATLQKSGKVFRIEENITSEVMRHFDKYCREQGIKYSAMKDERNPDKPSYMVFFEGKNSEVILHMMQEAYKSYMEAEKTAARRKISSRSRIKNGRALRQNLPFFAIGLQLGTENRMH